jgi:nucleoside-diphosphate-sugar epimerase
MKRILIVGGSGFIGTHLTTRLLALGHEVAIFDKAPSAAHPHRVTIGDVRDAPALAAAVAGCECIINLAAEHRDDVLPTSLYFAVNVGGAENLVRAAVEHGVARLIFFSTVALYGLVQPCADEAAALKPFNAYAQSKAQAEKVYSLWAAVDTARSLLILRPVVVFGEGNRGNVYNLIEQLRRRRLPMIGDGRNYKSLAYVGNIVEFVCQRLDIQGSELFNYSDPPDRTMRELVALICTLLKRPAPAWAIPYWCGIAAGYASDALALLLRRPLAISSVRVRKFCANTQVSSALLDATGFVRPHTIEEGLARTIATG